MLLPIPQAMIGYCSRAWLSSKAHVPFSVKRLYVAHENAGRFRIHGLAVKRAGDTEPFNLWHNEGPVSSTLFSDRVYEAPGFGPIMLRKGDELRIEVENIGANSWHFEAVWQGEAYLPGIFGERLPGQVDKLNPFVGWDDPQRWRVLGNVDTRAHKTYAVLETEQDVRSSKEYDVFYMLIPLVGAESGHDALRERPDSAIVLRHDEWDCVRDHFQERQHHQPDKE